MAAAVAMHHRRDFKVLGSSPEQNGYETGVSCYSAPCKIDDLWDVREVNMDFTAFLFFLVCLLSYSYTAAEPCVQQGLKKTVRSFFPAQWQDGWTEQSWCTALIHSVVLMEQMWTLHWQENTHTHLRAYTHTHTQSLCTKAQVDS